ncbi:MAG: hypothetical protein R6V35_01070 [Candidatus Nanohaloarchaea archaeon]
MSLDIGSALADGAQRTFKRNGLILAGLLFAVSILSIVFSNSLVQAMFDEGILPPEYMTESVPMALGLSSTVSGLGLFLTFIASAIVGITALRTLVSNETETIPREYFTRNLGLAIVNLFFGGIAFAVAVTLGFIALIIPGFFLLVSLYFWNVFVIVEDQNFIEAFKSSWNLTEGNRLELFGLGVIVFIGVAVISGIFGAIGIAIELLAGSTASSIFNLIPNAFLSVFTVATVAQAYNQLRE